jgi:O-antigen/teichoic acid export membrane protein
MSNTAILKNSVILYVRLIVTSLFGIITARILLNSLGAEDFGLYAVVGGIVLMMNFLNTAFISTSFRFIAFELGKEKAGKANEIFNISLVLHVVMAGLLLVLAETLGVFYIENYLKVAPGRIDEALFVFRFSVIAAIFAIISIPFQGIITAKENFSARAWIEILMAAVKFVAAFIVLNYEGDRLVFYAELMLIASMFGPLAFILYSKINYKNLTVFKFSSDWKTYKEFLAFSSWIMLGAGASIGKVQGTALIINLFFGTVINAAFGLANQLNTFILMFAQNVGQAAIPQITKSYSSGNFERTKNLTAVISKFSFFLMLIPSIPILLNTELVLTLWLKDLPEYIVIFCQLMIINALIESCSAGLPAAMQATGKIKYFQIILSCNMLLALPVSYLFYKYNYPAETIIIVFIVVSLINNFIAQFFLKFTIGFDLGDYFKRVYLGIIAVIVLISPIYLLNNFLEKNIEALIVFSLISTLWVLLSVFLVGLTKEEKLEVKEIVLKIKQKIKK